MEDAQSLMLEIGMDENCQSEKAKVLFFWFIIWTEVWFLSLCAS